MHCFEVLFASLSSYLLTVFKLLKLYWFVFVAEHSLLSSREVKRLVS